MKFESSYRVYYEDTDSLGVVYYANYLKFFERCRTDFLLDKNISQTLLSSQYEIVFVVRRCDIKFIKPAKFEDIVAVSVDVKKIGAASLILHQEMILDGNVLSTLDVEITSVDSKTFKPKKIPNFIKECLSPSQTA